MTPERLARLKRTLTARQPDLTVITQFLHKQRNTSAIVRICDAVGIMQAHAIAKEADYHAFRGTAMGAHNWVEVLRHDSLRSALDAVPGFQVVAAHPAPEAIDYRAVDYTRPTALLLGTEKAGLDEAAVACADRCVAIPMMGMVASYNVAVAAGIILAEAQRQRQDAGLYAACRLDTATYQRLLFQWGQPRLHAFCEARGLAYPAINEDGELLDGPAWYENVRAQEQKGDAI